MDEFLRRTFCAAIAASAGLSSGDWGARRRSSPDARRQDGRQNVTVVTTRRELESAFENLSPGETVRITAENAPYRTTQWLDVDVDDVTVVGPDVRTLVKPADSADVGGIRVGHDSQCSGIDVRGVGYHGNPSGQPEEAERLHGIAVRNATDVTLERNNVRRTYPVKHGNGGSAISVGPRCSDVRVCNNRIREYGDRGIQLAGERHVVFGNVVTTGLDRAVSCDLWLSGSENPAARNVSVFGNLLGDSVQGSLVGVSQDASASSRRGYVNVFGNVGFGSHKSFCHVRGSKSLRNVSVQNNVSSHETDELLTETTQFSGIAVDAAGTRNLAIRGNELYDYSGHGVRVDGDATDLAVQHNTVVDPGLAGIRFVGGSNGLVDGNFVAATGKAGIRLQGVDSTFVHGNYVRGTGTTGVVVGGSESATDNDVAANYVVDPSRTSPKAFPGILVRDDGVRVRGNSVRGSGGAAIAEPDDVSGNVYEGNWADGEDPWRFASPASRVRNNAPPTDVHRGVSAASGSTDARVEFDRAYARPPSLAFGRTGGGVRDVSYATDENGNYVGATITVERRAGTLDVFVNGR